jgi:hypothetical protein
MSMLSLDKYRWTYCTVTKASPAAVPGFKPIAMPRGYIKPKILDPHMEADGGYKVGTVRTWADGPHIKLHDGWYPYDKKSGHVIGDKGKKKHLKDFAAGVEPLHEEKKHVITRKSMAWANIELINIQRNAGKTSPQEDKDKIKGIYEGLTNFLNKVGEDESVKRRDANQATYLSETLYHALDEQIANIDEEKDPEEVGRIAYSLSHHLGDDLQYLVDQYERTLKRQARGEFKTKVLSNVKDNPELSILTQPLKEMSMLGGQGSVTITQLRELADGTKTVFKHDALSVPISRYERFLDKNYGMARREAATYTLNKLLGFDVVPPTALVSEPVYEPGLVDRLLPQRYVAAGWDPTEIDDIDPNADSEGSVQEFVEGETLSELGEVPKNADTEALHQILILDDLINNFDRHDDNVMFDKSGKPWAIDHGMSFVRSDRVFSNAVGKKLKEMKKTRIPDSVIDRVLDVDDQTVYDTMSEMIGDKDTSALRERLVSLKSAFSELKEKRRKNVPAAKA